MAAAAPASGLADGALRADARRARVVRAPPLRVPDAQLVAAVRAPAPLRRALARVAGRMVATRGWERLGFARLADYAAERAGVLASPRAARGRCCASSARPPRARRCTRRSRRGACPGCRPMRCCRCCAPSPRPRAAPRRGSSTRGASACAGSATTWPMRSRRARPRRRRSHRPQPGAAIPRPSPTPPPPQVSKRCRDTPAQGRPPPVLPGRGRGRAALPRDARDRAAPVLRCTGTAPDALRFELPVGVYTSGDVIAG